MEIRILLLFFLLTVLATDVIAFRKFSRGRSRGRSRVSSGGSTRGSSSGGSSRTRNSGHKSSSSGDSSHTGSSRHESSSSRHRIGSSSTRTSSSHTVHHRNNDTSTSFSHAERGGPTTPYWFNSLTARSSNGLSERYGTADWFDSPTKARSFNGLSERYGTDWFDSPTKARSFNGLSERYRTDWFDSPTKTRSSNELYGITDLFDSRTKARLSNQLSELYGIAGTYPGSQIGKPDFTTEKKQKAVRYKPSVPSTDHLSKASVIPSQSHVPTSSGQPNPSHGAQNNSSRSNSHFSPKQPTPNIGFKDRPNTMPDSSYTPASPYPPRTSYPIPGSNQHSPPYPIHPSGHSMNQSYPPYILSHFVPSQTIGHPSSYPAHIPSPVPGTFGNPYSTHPVDETYGPTGHSYPQQHVMAKPAAQPYIPGQTVIMVPGQQDSGGGFGQMVKEALVFSTINAGVNRLINPYPHYVSNSRPADPSSAPSESHVTYNNNYYYPPGNPPSASTSSNVPQGNVPVTHPDNYPAPVNNPAITPGVSIPTIVGNNSSVTSSTSNGSSVNTTNNMGGSSNGFSAGNSTAGTVNDQGTIVYSPQYKISDNDLSTLTEELFAKQDFSVFKYLTLHLQSKSENVTDAARGPLIYVDPELYDYPTISVIRALYDNYEHNSSVKENRTLEKRKKEDLLLNVFLNTNILTRAMQWLSDRGFIDPDDFEKKDTLRNIWFSQFNGATSGFERVFTSERYGVDLLGVQDWLYFNYQESKGRIDYMGYVDTLKLDNRTSLLKLNFKMDDIIRPNATIFIGTLPELEMSLYTICFYARTNDLCPVSLGGTKFNIFTHSFRYYGRDLIDLALPIF